MSNLLVMDVGGANLKFGINLDERTLLLGNIPYIFPGDKFSKVSEALGIVKEKVMKRNNVQSVGVMMTAPVGDHSIRKGTARYIALLRDLVGDREVRIMDNYANLLTLNSVNVHSDYPKICCSSFAGFGFLAQQIYGRGIGLEMGSNSTSIFSFSEKGVRVFDDKRILSNEVMWIGALHTFLDYIVEHIPLRGKIVKTSPLTALTFDVLNVTRGDKLKEYLELYNTKPRRTLQQSVSALAIFSGLDEENVDINEIRLVANYVLDTIYYGIREFVYNYLSRFSGDENWSHTSLVIAGFGEELLLAPALSRFPFVRLAKLS